MKQIKISKIELEIGKEKIIKEEILTRLHEYVGWCSICGKSNCSHGNSTLPQALTTEVVLRAINYNDENIPMPKGQEEYFMNGIFYTVALLVRLYDQPGVAADILKEAGIEATDCTNFDEFEKEQLRIINKENGINLIGL